MKRQLGTGKKMKWIILLVVVSMFAGCGENNNTVKTGKASGDEELVDPVVGIPAYDVASYRTLYDAEVYSALVCPSVEEYGYETKQAFGGYGKLPGETVNEGDVLLYGNTEEIDKKIEDMQEAIDEEERSYGESIADFTQDLTEAKKKEAQTGTDYIAVLSDGPDEENPYYSGFEKGVLPLEGIYKKAALERRRIEEQINELETTHALTKTHNEKLIQLLAAERENVVVTAGSSGHVVASGLYYSGDTITQGTKVAAVGDLSKKQLRTEFINQSTIQKAEDIYAIVDGVRTEVMPEIIDKTEYQRLQAKNGTVYSSFYPVDPDALSIGQYAVIVVVNEKREDVLCVPKDAVKKEGSAYFVNVYEEGETLHTEVKIGMRDGMYAEILEGLKAGDMVLSDSTPEKGKATKTLQRGRVCGEFSESGYLFYPTSEWIKNPAKTGTCYLKELCVSEYEPVKKDQVLAKVEVIPDEVEVNRLKRKIEREQERLSELIEEKSKDYSEEINYQRERAIRARNQSIQKLQKDLDELQLYAGVVELKASCDGMVMRMTEREAGDLIGYGEQLVELCGSERCYILVEDDQNRLTYGNKVTITYKDLSAMNHTVEGEVVTVNGMSLSSELATGYALISIDPEEVESILMSGSGQMSGSGWYRNRFTVETDVRVMEDVILVPKTAVKQKDGSYYVRVKSEDGISYVSFVPGGSDLSNFWAAAGLKEGMEICLD